MQSPQSALAIEGLSKLKEAALLMTISYILLFVGVSGGAALVFAIVPSILGGGHKAIAVGAIGSILIALAIIVVALILSLVAIFKFLIPAFNKLKEYNELSFGTPATLIKIGYLVGPLLILFGILVMVGGIIASASARSVIGIIGAVLGGEALILIGLILLLIGTIGLIIGCIRLRDAFKENLFLIAGILFIVGIVTAFIPHIGIFVSSVIDLISWIMIFVACSSTIHKLRTYPTNIPRTIW